MSVVSATRSFRNTGGDNVPLTSGDLTITHRLPYDVIVTAGTTAQEVLDSPLVPQEKTAHPDGLYMRVVDRQYEQLSPIFFRVYIEYSATGLNPATQNPMDMRPTIRYVAEDFEEELEEAIDVVDGVRKAIQTVCKERFAQSLRENIPIPLLYIRRNVGWVSPAVLHQYRNSVNSDSFYGMPIGTLLMRRLEAEEIVTDDFAYFSVEAYIAMKLGAWNNTTDDRAWDRKIKACGHLAAYKVFNVVKYLPAIINGKLVGSLVNHRLFPSGGDGSQYASATGNPGGQLLGEKLPDSEAAQWYYWRTKNRQPYGMLGLI